MEVLRGDSDLYSTASIFIGKIQVNAHFLVENEFENDISPKEFNTLEDHHKLVNYLTDLSKLLGKAVSITPENQHDINLVEVLGTTINYT